MKKQAQQKGFTLIEIGVVLAIIGVLAAITIPSVSYMLRRSRVQSLVGSLPTIKGYVAALASSSAGGGTVPVTEGNPPRVGTALVGQDRATVSKAARLDMAFVSAGITDKLVSFGLGSQLQVPDGTGSELQWSPRYRAFYIDDEGTGVPSASGVCARDWSKCSRVEARVSTPGTPPSSALGGNFRLNGSSNMTANTVVAYVVLRDVPYKDAIELSKALNGDDLTTATESNGLAQDNGPVVFAPPAADSAVTDVYVYVSHI